tara:strand:+ start:283 stop:663 length:381 start_codon:yes stop_codon:yes gene_type:complete
MSIFGKVGQYKWIPPTNCCRNPETPSQKAAMAAYYAAKQRSPWMRCMNRVNKADFSKYIPGAGIPTSSMNRGVRAALLRRATGSVTVNECCKPPGTNCPNCKPGQTSNKNCACWTNKGTYKNNSNL